MKKAFRYLLIVLGVVVVLVAGAAGFVAVRGIPSYDVEKVELKVEATPERLAQGQRLASMLCNSCHLDPNTGKLTGKKMEEASVFGEIYSKNITKDMEHGIGKWTDGELAYLLRTGIKPDGTFLPIMAKLARASDEDVKSIIAFLRSDHAWVAPDNTRQPDTKYAFLPKFLTNAGLINPSPFTKTPIANPDTTNLVTWGRYIVQDQLECYTCHSGDFTKLNFDQPEKSYQFLGGGNKMDDGAGNVITTRNITMDEETGIGKWTEEQFIQAVKFGKVPHGPALRQPMIPYMAMTDSEAKAIYAYLKTVPKIKNKIDR
jgi:cytochrome c2